LVTHAASNPGSSTRIARAVVLDTPPSLAIGEITDKGSINQRAVLAARAAIVDSLYLPDLGANIIQVKVSRD
jgi:feruloyl-CoA synthase